MTAPAKRRKGAEPAPSSTEATPGGVAVPETLKLSPVSRFDPWPYVELGLTGRGDVPHLPEVQALLVRWARDLEDHRPETGFDLLVAMVRCAENGIPVPDWLAAQCSARMHSVTALEVDSLDAEAAFGPTPQSTLAERLETAARRARYAHVVRIMFKPEGPFPRTKNGYRKVAALIGIKPSQVEDLLPKTRQNVRKLHPHNWFA